MPSTTALPVGREDLGHAQECRSSSYAIARVSLAFRVSKRGSGINGIDTYLAMQTQSMGESRALWSIPGAQTQQRRLFTSRRKPRALSCAKKRRGHGWAEKSAHGRGGSTEGRWRRSRAGWYVLLTASVS